MTFLAVAAYRVSGWGGKQKWRGATIRQVGASTAGRAETTKFYRTYIVNNVKFVLFCDNDCRNE